MNVEKSQCLDVQSACTEDIRKYTSLSTFSENIPEAAISLSLILVVDTPLYTVYNLLTTRVVVVSLLYGMFSTARNIDN